MKQYAEPAVAKVADDDNLTAAPWANADAHGGDVAYRRLVGDDWQDVTFATFRDEVAAAAKGFIAAGLQPGDRVGLISKTRYEWTLLDYALWAAGAVTLPIYETSSSDQVEWCLSDSGARGVIVEDDAHREIVESLREKLPDLQHVWQIDGADGAVAALRDGGAGVDDATLEERRKGVHADHLATLIYTSGTTGRPKGCEITHRNLLFEVRAVADTFSDLMQPGNATLLFLPLAHIFARVIQCAAMEYRYTIGHFADTKKLTTELPRFKPDFLLSVPRVFEKVYNGAKVKAHNEGKGRIFDMAEATAVDYSKALDHGGPGIALRLRHALFDKLVYSRLRAALGGQCQGAVSGGSALGARIGHFFRGIGVPIHEGYGLTETSAAITANPNRAVKVGTVGKPIPGVTIAIAEDGEILAKGDVVFRGYWNNPDATASAIVDGWFHTGDLGDLDDDGYLSITGRKKELIVTAGGKNVAPAVLEDRVRAHRLVSQALVVGDNRPYVGALITLDAEALPGWSSEQGKEGADASALAEDPDLQAEIAGAIEEANKAVSRAEAIRQWRILASDFTEESGELTPTMKLKRNVIAEKRAADIEAVYER
ncbi:AMP-dependent synthetase/ligase [Actinomycetospora cinnamomea]|uniref:Long-chain acyl-CoA synthetase n=1 Tax=Actinomycetospora cinnamomea TaxID=663609 RepID=A0A2U1F9S8_9PSEU|nr:long-chain fatty acid--CoA ligase [Actinomycetospora cinnamomea]PVZ08953.1 long-chain acyl-CoA synthetase [Actinomycetospora cinnamomea]